MFKDQQGAFERLVIMGELSRDSKQVKGYDYETDLKVALRKREREEKETVPIPMRIGKHVGKRVEKPPTPIHAYVGKPISVGELLQSREKAQWIVDSFGAQGATVMLSADVGTGKTTFLYSLASSISKGEPFLKNDEGIGQLETKKKKVLYVQADEPKNDCWRKCKLMGLDPDAFDFVFGEDGWNTLDLQRLEQTIDRGNYGVVMLDSVTTLLGNQGISMKDPEFAHPLYALNQLASRKNILVVITSHLRKLDRNQSRNGVTMHDVLGAGSQAGAVSDVWAIWRQPQSSPREFKFVLSCLDKARNCEVGTTWSLTGNQEDLTWTFKSAGGDELPPSERKDLKTYAKEYLSESDKWRSINEIATHFHKSPEHTRRVLVDLFVEDEIERKQQKLGLAVGGRPLWVYRRKRGFPT